MYQSSTIPHADTEERVRERSRRLWIEHGQPHGCDSLIWDYANSLVAAEDQLGRALSDLRYRILNGQEQQLYDRLLPSRFENIAENKPATMSSRSQWSVGTIDEDASRGTSQGPGLSFSFHTDFEDNPWWRVDLEEIYTIERIRLFNRVEWIEGTERFNRFSILTSDDAETWVTVFEKDDDTLVTGVVGYPFIWTADRTITARYIKLQSNARTALHLNRVEIYGY